MMRRTAASRWLRMKAVVKQADASRAYPSSSDVLLRSSPPCAEGIDQPSTPAARRASQESAGQTGSASAALALAASFARASSKAIMLPINLLAYSHMVDLGAPER